jgi:hypothetical protein
MAVLPQEGPRGIAPPQSSRSKWAQVTANPPSSYAFIVRQLPSGVKFDHWNPTCESYVFVMYDQ